MLVKLRAAIFFTDVHNLAARSAAGKKDGAIFRQAAEKNSR
jgi:hypothetical protein